VIQDRMFDILGNLLFPDGLPFFVPNAQHPFWNPEFLGDVMTVNGKAWPFLNVDGQRYRFRLLNGSNARFYNMTLSGGGGGKGKGKKSTSSTGSFWVIGTDGGLLDNPVQVSSLLIAPGERYDVIVDFAGLEGKTLTLLNDAKSPYPFGGTADPQTVGQIAQFRVNPTVVGADTTYNPATDGPLRDGTAATPPPIDRLVDPATGTLVVAPDKTRQLTLNETPGPFGPLDAVLNNTFWGGTREDGTSVSDQGLELDTGTVAATTSYLTEMPQVGSTEVWEIINLTGDAHPIHLHLVQFQVLNRQGYSVRKYNREYLKNFPGGAAANPHQAIFIPHFGPPLDYNTPNADGAIGGNPAFGPFLSGSPIPPKPYEAGWKDTVIALPKQVTRIAVRWTKQDGTAYDFDSTAIGNPVDGIVTPGGSEGGPGYVWHCHIIDHEDNEMMRPYVPVNNANNILD
jgi:spore coat protein A